MKFSEMEKDKDFEIPEFAQSVFDEYKDGPDLTGNMDDKKVYETVMNRINNLNHIKESEDDTEDFPSILYAYEDYIENDHNGEVVETADQMSRVYNSIDELNAEYADWADTVSKEEADDYYDRLQKVIADLKAFAEEGTN